MKLTNPNAILAVLRDKGPCSQSELIAFTKLGKESVGYALHELKECNRVFRKNDYWYLVESKYEKIVTRRMWDNNLFAGVAI